MFTRNDIPLHATVTFLSSWDQRGQQYRVIRRSSQSVTVQSHTGTHYSAFVATVPYADILTVHPNN